MMPFLSPYSVFPLAVPELRAQHDRDPAELRHGPQPPRGRGHRVRVLRGQPGRRLPRGELEGIEPRDLKLLIRFDLNH